MIDTLSAVQAHLYQKQTVEWVLARVVEGEALLKQDKTFQNVEKHINFVMGDQLPDRPSTLSQVTDNRTKKAVLETVAALTDIHPLFGFRSENPHYQEQVVILDKLTRAWWINSFADLRLADVVRYGSAAGSGYCEVNFDKTLEGGKGDLILTAVDPRDVIPINPRFDVSIQSWDGVIIRSMETISTLQARYGVAAAGLTPDRSGAGFASRMWGAAKTLVQTPMSIFDTVKQTQGHNMPVKVPAKETFKVYLKDTRLHTGDAPITMGEPGTSWSYVVYPVGFEMPNGRRATEKEARLYPRGRLLVVTRDRVLYDGPNPYWHGMFPIAKLTLDPWPWSLLGGSLVGDLMPMQTAINEVLNGWFDYVRKVLRPAVIADKRSVPASLWNRLDTRLPGQKIQQNPTAGRGMEFVKNDPLPDDVMEFFQFCLNEIDHLSGVANLQALMQLNQAPAADSIEKMQEALSPLLRNKSRLLECFLREVGEMIKSGFFQFYNLPRRVAILGEIGVNLTDFDYDPGTLVPALTREDAGYTPDLDASLPVSTRAQAHQANFTFQMTPNSLLSLSQLSRKLTYLQLFKLNLMDPWSLWESLEVPNGGSPPEGAETIAQRIVAARLLGLAPDPSGMTMMMLGEGAPGGQGSGPGRPASFTAPPEIKQKQGEDGVPRTTVTSNPGD